MKIKMYGIIGLAAGLFFMACKDKSPGDKLTDFVKQSGNRLTQKTETEGAVVVSQFVPDKLEEENTSPVYRFLVTVQSPPEITTDSILYFFNYHSGDYFRLVAGTDTLRPVLSERMANGRRDLHQFTVLFDRAAITRSTDSLEVLFIGNKLFRENLLFRYALTDIKNATKTLYGYE